MSNSSLVLLGGNPAVYDKTNPIVIFIIQAAIVIVFCRLLHFPLAYIRQPRVIAEVIGGILLGPTAAGRIPHFTTTIFPTAAMPNFNLIANIGLILFLFIVGLEVDLRIVRKNARVALSVGAASLALPFAIGCLIAYLIYREYSTTLSKDNFGIFLLFIGTAFSITAFPVLARILTELKLLRTNVGITVLSAGVGNDVVGWVLLALTIALVNASSGLTAFYVILLVVAWTLVLFFAVKPAYRWCLRNSSMSSGPSKNMMTVTILLVLVSAFFTEIIGVHTIFGAFLVGLIIPHDNGYAVALTDKIEDLVSVFFLPLYFASSGLKTNIGLLNDGKAWGYTILIIVAATVSKFVGSTMAARTNGFLWRESGAVGILMSCKGLVELIVLNVGLSAGILTTKLFTMFVIMALVTTFITTPITMWLYPEWYQTKVAKWRAGETDWDGNALSFSHETDSVQTHEMTRLAVVLHHVEGMASLLQLTHFLATPQTRVRLIRTIELTERLSQLIQVSENAEHTDSLISIFRAYASLLSVRLAYAIETLDLISFSSFIETESDTHRADLTILSWNRGGIGGNEYIMSLLATKTLNLAVIIDSDNQSVHLPARMISTSSAHERVGTSGTNQSGTRMVEASHIYFPMFSVGPDELLALRLLEQCKQANLTIQIVHFKLPSEKGSSLHDKYTIPEGPNISFEVIDGMDTLAMAIERESVESSKGSVTTFLANSVHESMESQLTSEQSMRGGIVEVFAGQKFREGQICVISARY